MPTIPWTDMYIPKAVSLARRTEFFNKKFKVLCRLIRKLEMPYVSYSANEFLKMVKAFKSSFQAEGLRIYFATYDAESSQGVPTDYGSCMTFVFAPTTTPNPNESPDIGKYFFMNPDDVFNIVDSEIDKSFASHLVQNYIPKRNELNRTMNPSGKGETTSMFYKISDLLDLEVIFKLVKATGIHAHFSSLIIDDNADYNNRMVLDFMLTRRVGDKEVEFFLEDVADNDPPPAPADPTRSRAGHVPWTTWPSGKVHELDTGNPCPPASCFGSTLP